MRRIDLFSRAKTSPLEVSDAPMPALHGIYWLKRKAGVDRMLRIARWASYLLPIAIFLGMAYVYFRLGLDAPESLSPAKQKSREELLQLSALLLLTLAGFPFMVHFAAANFRRQLGTDGHRLYVRLSDGTQVSFAPEQMIYGWREIRYKDLAVPVQTGHGQALYVEGELETYIAPLLKRAKKLGPLALLRYELMHPDRLMIFVVLFIGVLLALFVATGLWEKTLFAGR